MLAIFVSLFSLLIVYNQDVTAKVLNLEDVSGNSTNNNTIKTQRNWLYVEDENSKEVVVGILKHDEEDNNLPRSLKEIGQKCNFTLYTVHEPDGVGIPNPELLAGTSFDPKKKTKFITHGWLSSGRAETCISIKNGYLKNYDYNIIIFDWSRIASNIIYPIPASDVPIIAEYYTLFLSGMITSFNVDPKNIHMIGHSLGAHITGLVGRKLNDTKLARITGLDPALPGFDNVIIEKTGIRKDSAEFVDVIHTCAGLLGLADDVGHVDFYPNGGSFPQPGCPVLLITESCSHGRSWKYFADSLLFPEEPFFAYPCDSYSDFKKMDCDESKITVMGDPVSLEARGKYYLKTHSEKPFSLGHYSLTSNFKENL